jgi:anti-anti-sigma factor
VEINVKEGDGEAIVEISGRIDANSSALLQSAFDGMSEDLFKGGFALDFSAVDYISSAGLRVLLILQKKIKASGGSLSVRNLDSAVREVFDMTGFSAMFKII